MACAIWYVDVDASEAPTAGDWRDIDSPRVGGTYRLVGSIEPALDTLSDEQRMSLSRWIMQQHELGVRLPEINSYNLKEASTLPRLTFSDKVRVVLLFIAKRLTRLDDSYFFYHHEPVDADVGAMLSLAELHDSDELRHLLATMFDMKLLVRKGDQRKERTDFWLTPHGWERVEELSTRAIDPSQGFVAMWFHPDTDAAYHEGIAPAITEAGYKALRIDNKEHANFIHDEMIAEIRRSRFMVADFTCEPEKVRGSVYFEAGYALGRDIPVIWTCREDVQGHLHFDTRPYSYIFWKDPADLRQRLAARIGAVVGDGPLKQR